MAVVPPTVVAGGAYDGCLVNAYGVGGAPYGTATCGTYEDCVGCVTVGTHEDCVGTTGIAATGAAIGAGARTGLAGAASGASGADSTLAVRGGIAPV